MSASDNSIATIYTDGSCHTQYRTGAWAAIIFMGGEKTVLSGAEEDTTHNRMELTAVIKAMEYVRRKHQSVHVINIISDSQYVIGLTGRKEKLSAKEFTTKKGMEIRNIDLVKELLNYEDCITVNFIKTKAHQKKHETANYNIEADKLCRRIVREKTKTIP